MSERAALSNAAIWGWPAILGVLTSIGLVSALFSDGGLGDQVAGVCLAAPVAVAIWFGWLRRSPSLARSQGQAGKVDTSEPAA